MCFTTVWAAMAGLPAAEARDKQLEADLGAARALHAIHAMSLSLSLTD